MPCRAAPRHPRLPRPPPSPAAVSAVVLLPDVFGFDTPETKGAAKILAQQGYKTLVPDIYR